MKEKIYTIPINEALDEDCFCPFCAMYDRLEEDAVQYTVGPAMMEPDFRIITNRTGFCQKHIRELNSQSKALPLSLVLGTHLDSLCEIMDADLTSSKKGFFKKGESAIDETFKHLNDVSCSCAVCDRINNTFDRYFEVFVYMLKKESGFLDKVLSKEGFCMEHFVRLFDAAKKSLSDSDFQKYFVPIANLQKKRLKTVKEYINKFSNSFDYRNIGKEKDFPSDIILQASYLLNGTFKPKPKKLDNI